MNYNKIQEILQGDSKFAPLVANRDTKVAVRGGEASYAALTVRIAQEMAARGIEDKGWQKTMILAFAMKLSGNAPAPVRASAPPKVTPAKKVVEEKVERVTVRPTTNPAAVSPARQQAVQQNVKLEQFVERGDIVRYQSAVASCQLLASMFQLAETDTWPGNEKRKELLNELLESYEEMAKSHVNLSVREIIIRAKTEAENRR